MTPTKLLLGQILVVFAIVIGALWSATQWTAARLAHQPRLGPSWFELAGTPVYPPWRLFEWWYAFEPYAPEVFNRGGMIAAAGGTRELRCAAEDTFGDDECDLVRAIRESAQDNANTVGERLTERNLGIQPTVTVRPGWPLRVIVHSDLVLRPYGG